MLAGGISKRENKDSVEKTPENRCKLKRTEGVGAQIQPLELRELDEFPLLESILNNTHAT